MKRILTITAVSLLALSPMYGQDSCRYPQDPTLEKSQAYAGYDCVTLLDSTAVTVQPTGSGAFAVCKAFKVQTPKGAVANRIIKYDYDPLTAHAEFRYATIYRANGDVINLDVTGACDYAAPARAIYWGARQIMLEVGRLQPGDVVEYEIAKKGFTYALLTAGDDEDSFTISSPSGLPSLPCVRYTGYPCRWRKSCNSSSTKANVPLPCDMRMDGKYIPSPPTISFLSPRNRIW